MNTPSPEERIRRWRLVLGDAEKSDGTGWKLSPDDLQIDAALSSLYDARGSGDELRGH